MQTVVRHSCDQSIASFAKVSLASVKFAAIVPWHVDKPLGLYEFDARTCAFSSH